MCKICRDSNVTFSVSAKDKHSTTTRRQHLDMKQEKTIEGLAKLECEDLVKKHQSALAAIDAATQAKSAKAAPVGDTKTYFIPPPK
jgi:hypothetical protein